MLVVQSWVTSESFWESIYNFPPSKTLVKKKEKHPGACSKSASLEIIGKEQFERLVESHLWSQAKPRENNPQKGTGNIPHKITLWPHVHRQLFLRVVAITLWGEGCPSPRTAVSGENQSCLTRISSLALARFPDKVDLCRCCCFYKRCHRIPASSSLGTAFHITNSHGMAPLHQWSPLNIWLCRARDLCRVWCLGHTADHVNHLCL